MVPRLQKKKKKRKNYRAKLFSTPIVANRWPTFESFDLSIFVRYVRFICVRLDWYLYDWIDICVSSI